MTKLEYSSCSGPSYTDLLPQASAGGNREWNETRNGETHRIVHACAEKVSDLAS